MQSSSESEEEKKEETLAEESLCETNHISVMDPFHTGRQATPRQPVNWNSSNCCR